ncbi:MAG: glycogen-binding domain-containing protein [bacterium]
MSIYSQRVRSIAGAALACLAGHQAAAQQFWPPFVSRFVSPFTSPFASPFVGLSSTPSGPFAPTAASIVLAPGMRFETSRSTLLTQLSTTLNQSSPRFESADVSTRTSLWRPAGLETALLASGQYDRGSFAGGPSSNSALRMQVGNASAVRGLELGFGADAWRSTTISAFSPATTLSAWVRRFGLSFTAEANAHNLLLAGRDPSDTGFVDTRTNPPGKKYSSSETRHFGDSRLRVSGTILSLGVDAELGRTFLSRGGGKGFGSFTLTRWLSPALALTAGMVVQPANPGLEARRGAIFGVRLGGARELIPRLINAPKPTVMTTTVRYADTTATVEVGAPGANRVEISGDFTHWNPVTLERQSGDRWTLVTPITPGLHHVVLRVNGGNWTPPPGLPQAVDVYEGTVGVIVAPSPPLTTQH